MKIKRLYLGDFGIFRNEKIENISPEIVVIGGLNRAGKSTFMEVLRHLGYGFGKGENISKANIQYKIEGDVINEFNEEFNISIDGYGEPRVNSINNKNNLTALEIYNNLDSYSYKQLFTISLDELRKINSKDEEKIQSILLGAGLNEIVEIPKIVSNLRKEAEKIGGKLGNPNSKMFKPYNQRIISALNRRNEEIKNLDRFMEISNELMAGESKITDTENILKDLADKIILLDILKSNFSIYIEKKELELRINELNCRKKNVGFCTRYTIEKLEELREEYTSKTKAYDESISYFKLETDDKYSTYNKLIEFADILSYYERKVSAINEKIKNYFLSQKSYETDKQNIIFEMKKINDHWNDNFIEVLDINTDVLSTDDLNKLCLEYEILQDDMKDLRISLENMDFQKNLIEKKLKSTIDTHAGLFPKNYLYISLGVIILGIFMTFINKITGTALIFAGSAGIVFYGLTAYNHIANNGNKNKELYIENEEITAKQELELNKLEKLNMKHNSLSIELEKIKQALGIWEDISTDGLKDYFRSIQDIKRKILILGTNGRNLENIYNEINEELKNIYNIILEFPELIPQKNDIIYDITIVKDYSDILKALEQLISYVNHARDVKKLEQEKEIIEKKIKDAIADEYLTEDLLEGLNLYTEQVKLNNDIKNLEISMTTLGDRLKHSFETSRVKTALREFGGQNNDLNNIIDILYSNYPNQSLIETEYDKLNKEYEEKKELLDALKENKHTLKDRLVRLSTIENLEKAQRDLDESRGELRGYAEKFAIYNTASFILDTVQKSFINKVKNHLFEDATKILDNITGGELCSIIPTDNLLSLDYKSVSYDGTVNDTIDILSRGTGEQIFLSVRLGRLKKIKPSLPVVFDDCFVNFDNIHIKNTVKVVNDLGKENQVFILTCHPQLIKCLSDYGVSAQYWQLEKGRFSLSNSEELYKYLLNGQ